MYGDNREYHINKYYQYFSYLLESPDFKDQFDGMLLEFNNLIFRSDPFNIDWFKTVKDKLKAGMVCGPGGTWMKISFGLQTGFL